MVKAIEWTGDLDDDCTARWNGYVGREECMGDHTVTNECGEKLPRSQWWKCEGWWFQVYAPDRTDLFGSNDAGGLVTTGDLARAICEQVMFWHYEAKGKRC